MSENTQLFSERIREERFRQCSSRAVEYAPGFCDRARLVEEGSKAERDLLEIVRLLASGALLPDRFYRNGIGRDRDELLEVYGIKHLHLGGPTSDILLFLVEYDEKVVLLEINSHTSFSEKPVGSALRSIHESALRKSDQQSLIARKSRVAEKSAIAAKGLLKRRDR